MKTASTKQRLARQVARALVSVVVLATTLIVAPFAVPDAAAQAGEPLEVWGISGGIVTNPKEWMFLQSDINNNPTLGSTAAAALALDDSGWGTRTLHFDETPGSNVASHFRKDFEIGPASEIGVELNQILGIRVKLRYDDSAVLYLNGTEVYRSIRGNNDPTYANYPIGTDIPYDPYIAYGGFENFFVHIPNWLGTNDCEFSGPQCGASPYANNPPGNPGTDPPEIPFGLLQTGTNTWGVTVWNQSGGGSGDVQLNHVFELLIDPDAVPASTIKINEVMASNNTTYGVDLDGFPGFEYPDWFELHNTSLAPVDISGYTVSDSAFSWVFPPGTMMAANEYLVVVANDGDDGTTSPMQTNFKLSTAGDSLKLTNEMGFVSDDYGAMPPHFTDNAYGRVLDGEPITYLAAATPGATNSVAGNGYAPILRLFADRLYNEGEPIDHQVNAFDPDGDALTYSLTPLPPGVLIDSATGRITGSAATAGTYLTTLEVIDGDSDRAEQPVTWTFYDPPPNPPVGPPIVMNEYNAVADTRFLLSGDPPMGNGGDWFEFVVVQDQLDLRGFTFDMYDKKGPDDQLRLQSTVTFANRIELSAVPSGTVIVISEENVDDLSFNAQTDWTIYLQIDNTANGVFFETEPAGSLFNSTRTDQMVVIRDGAGVVVAPLSGETEAWDEANGGVSGGEVMDLCVNPSLSVALDPVADYKDNGTTSTIGEPNECSYPDPVEPTITITFDQDFSDLRSAASLGKGNGDVNCDGVVNLADALLVLQYTVGSANDTGPCLLDQGGPGAEMSAIAGDVNLNDSTNVGDALMMLQCIVGQTNSFCP